MRNIDENIWRDDWFAEQEPIGKLIWIGIISKVADDQGRFRNNADLVKSDLFPMSKTPDADEIDKWLIWFATSKKLVIYEANGKKYLQVANWWKYQSGATWMSASQHPAPAGWVDCWRYHTKGNRIEQSPNWLTKQAGFDKLPSELPSAQDSNDINDEDDNDIDDDEGKSQKTQSVTRPPIYTLYETNIGPLTPIIADALKDAETAYPGEWIGAAFEIAIKNNAPRWNYVKAVLDGWQRNGRQWTPARKGNGNGSNNHQRPIEQAQADDDPDTIRELLRRKAARVAAASSGA